jgi:hypothetical protein
MNKEQVYLMESGVVLLCRESLKNEQFDRRQIMVAKREYEKQIDEQLKKGLDLRSIL